MLLFQLTACGGHEDRAPADLPELGKSMARIINGQLDFEHDAVVALFTGQSGCTGTIVHQADGHVYVLTAAHCFQFGAIEYVVVGDNYNSPDATALLVNDYQVHSQFSQQNLSYDFAMVRASSFQFQASVIPPLPPSLDTIQTGTPVEHVGYGVTSYPNGSTTQRHRTTGQIAQAATLQISYNQPQSGPCSGDSGGPNLVEIGGQEYVGGVTSYGDEGCAIQGVSGRVSAIYNSFIVPFIGEDPLASTSASSSTAATTTSGAGGGVSTTGAGGGAAAAGAGGSDSVGWAAGNTKRDDVDGILLTSGCGVATGGGGDGAAPWPLFGALVLLGGWRRRRAR